MSSDAGNAIPNISDETITRAVSRELHNAAQPLTVLQGLLEMMVQNEPLSDPRHSTSLALEQLRRVGICFDNLRRLVHLQPPAHDVENISVSSLLASVLKELETTFEALGLRCRLAPTTRSDSADSIRVSRQRANLAFRLIFTTLLARLKTGECFSVSVETTKSTVLIGIRPETSQTHLLPRLLSLSEQGLTDARLDLAHALVLSIGGDLHLARDPYSLEITLRKLPVSVARGNAARTETKSMHG